MTYDLSRADFDFARQLERAKIATIKQVAAAVETRNKVKLNEWEDKLIEHIQEVGNMATKKAPVAAKAKTPAKKPVTKATAKKPAVEQEIKVGAAKAAERTELRVTRVKQGGDMVEYTDGSIDRRDAAGVIIAVRPAGTYTKFSFDDFVNTEAGKQSEPAATKKAPVVAVAEPMTFVVVTFNKNDEAVEDGELPAGCKLVDVEHTDDNGEWVNDHHDKDGKRLANPVPVETARKLFAGTEPLAYDKYRMIPATNGKAHRAGGGKRTPRVPKVPGEVDKLREKAFALTKAQIEKAAAATEPKQPKNWKVTVGKKVFPPRQLVNVASGGYSDTGHSREILTKMGFTVTKV